MRTTTLLLAFSLLTSPSLAAAASDGPVDVPPPDAAAPAAPSAQAPVTAEARYNEGEALARAGAWAQAESAYRAATGLRADFPEAWNGLGHSLKMQGKYPDAHDAYRRALELRPDYPQALEYAGETFVAMGRMEDARAMLAKLQPLDAKLAARLEAAINSGKLTTAW
jgi:Flp pilus assembly protein TadD